MQGLFQLRAEDPLASLRQPIERPGDGSPVKGCAVRIERTIDPWQSLFEQPIRSRFAGARIDGSEIPILSGKDR